MKGNTRKKWRKVATTEAFMLHRSATDPSIYSVRWTKWDGKAGNRRFSAPSIAEALDLAPVRAGLVAEKPRQIIRIVEAFDETLGLASRGPKSTEDWNYFVKRFIGWLAEHHPDCQCWHLLTRQIIREYLSVYRDKSATMRRLALQPICQTSGHMHREHGFVNFAERLGIGSKLNNPPKEVFLVDVVRFCDFLKGRNPRIEAGVALQSLVGLQLQEATRLTWDKVNLDRGLVEISGEVKNDYRNRVIPVCNRAKEALERAFRLRPMGKIVAVQEHVLVSRKGLPYGKSWLNYSKEVVASLKAWNPKVEFKPKDLRNCLFYVALELGCARSDTWEQYQGHRANDVTGIHYIPRLASVTLGEGEALERRMALFRRQVVEPLNARIEGGPEPEILNFFERGTGNLLTRSKTG